VFQFRSIVRAISAAIGASLHFRTYSVGLIGSSRTRPSAAVAAGATRRQRLWLVLGAMLVLGVLGLTSWIELDARRIALNGAVQASENLVVALSHEIERNIESLDLSLHAVIDGLRLAEITSVSPELRNSILFDRSTTAKHVGAILVVDAFGNVIIDSSGAAARRVKLDTNESFTFHRDHAESGLHVSPPFKSNTTGEWQIGLSHRLAHPDGSFAGIVIGSLRLAYFNQLFDAVDLGPGGTATLIGSDAKLIYRKPMGEQDIGRHLVNAVSGRVDPVNGAGVFEAVATIDGVRRVYVYRHLSDLPLTLTIGFAKAAALAEWNLKALVNGAALAGLALVASLLMAVVLHELQRRGEAERIALKSKKRYRLLADHSSDVIFRWGLDGFALYVSPAVQEVLGYRADELVGTMTLDLVHPDDKLWSRDVARAMAGGLDRAQTTSRFRHRDGRWVWADATMRLVRDEHTGAPLEIVGSLRDVTQREAATEALRRSEAMFRLLTDHSSDMISLSDPRSQTRYYVSPASRSLVGYEPEEIVGRPNTDFVFPADMLPEGRRTYLAMLADTGRTRFSYRFRCKDGSYVWVEANVALTTDPETGAPAVLTSLRDISERVRQEETLLAAKDEADAANRAKSEFLANMSHEIRTPMNGILGMTGLLLDTALDPVQRSYAEMVREAGDALMTIINDILDISKLEAGKVELESIDFNIADAVRSAIAILEPKAQEKAIELVVSVAPAVPAMVRGDPTRLRQILLNLIGNGLKFTDRGRVSLAVSTAPATDDASAPPRLHFTVTDTGIGMTEDICAKLFQKFQQADSSTTRRFGGTGLGLAISSELVALQGGTIGVSSRPGAGSTFWFELPLAPAVAPALALRADGEGIAAKTIETEAPRRKLRVLLAEDIEINRRLAVAIIGSAGHEVDIAENGRRAVAAVEHRDYDVVLMDVQMPELDGEQATRLIRAMAAPKCAVPIIALTAHAMSGARDHYLALGMNDYITKPIDPALLLAKLAAFASADSAGSSLATLPDTTRDATDESAPELTAVDRVA
jgi:PAS domain S-box-containing protein